MTTDTIIRHGLTNYNADNELLPISDKALANMQAFQEIDGLHEYGPYNWHGYHPESVWERLRKWLDHDDWGPEPRTKKGLPVPGWRSQCLEQHPALALHLALNSSFRCYALSAECALDAGRSIQEVARIARLHIPADTDPRRLRVRRGLKGRWRIDVVDLHPSMRNEKRETAKSSRSRKKQTN